MEKQKEQERLDKQKEFDRQREIEKIRERQKELEAEKQKEYLSKEKDDAHLRRLLGNENKNKENIYGKQPSVNPSSASNNYHNKDYNSIGSNPSAAVNNYHNRDYQSKEVVNNKYQAILNNVNRRYEEPARIEPPKNKTPILVNNPSNRETPTKRDLAGNPIGYNPRPSNAKDQKDLFSYNYNYAQKPNMPPPDYKYGNGHGLSKDPSNKQLPSTNKK